MPLRPHSREWYDRLATMQTGYWYPWHSSLSTGNGEDAYLDIVQKLVRPELDVLDVACGHGELSLEIAARCHSLFGYDRVPAYIEIARRSAFSLNVRNARFECADSSAEYNGGRVQIPAPDHAFDVLLCRRGPHHWIEDARRVARPGATLAMLVPNLPPATSWSARLPAPLGWNDVDDPLWARDRLATRLASNGLLMNSYWVFVVPEYFANPQDLYQWRAWGYSPDEIPTYPEVQRLLERVFAQFAGPHGLAVHHSRFLWTAIVSG